MSTKPTPKPYYPCSSDCGYTWSAEDLFWSEQRQEWIHVTITEQGNSKFLTVHSCIHMNKEVRLNPTYSTDFSDTEIIKDLSGKISGLFL